MKNPICLSKITNLPVFLILSQKIFKNQTFEWALVIVSNSVFYPTEDAIQKDKKNQEIYFEKLTIN